jgi:serine phosphatase RsbU (regulator of sigma subunit)
MTVAVSFLSGAWNDSFGTREWLVRSLLCTAVVGLSIAMAHTRVQREKALLNMTVIAETAQRALLRALPDELEGLRLSARYLSASDGASVGGDLYEVLVTPYGVRVLVGDARGKGLDAVQMAGTVLGAFRRAAFQRQFLADVAVDLDSVAAAVAGDEDFVTALLAEIHDDGSVTLANCGHHPPLLMSPDSGPGLVDTGPATRPLGLGALPVPITCRWQEGSRMLLYTDGLVEARDPSGEFFPLVDHAEVLAGGPVDDSLAHLVERLARHTTTRLADDLALLLIENCRSSGGSPAGTAGPAAVPIAR